METMSMARFLAAERKRLVAYARRLIDDAADRDGEDIVQNVALKLFCRADVLMPIATLYVHFYQSIRNRAIISISRRRDERSLDETGEDGESCPLQQLPDIVADAEKELARKELKRKIFEAIDGLPDEQKAIVIETELNGRSFRELSTEWGIPLGTLLARKSRAIAKVREALREFAP